MHERSLVKGLIDQVLEEARVRGLGRLHNIRLQIGEFAGVEPRLVESAFEELAPSFWDHHVQLVLESVQLTAMCRNCQSDFQVEGFRFLCPLCGSGNVEVTAGEEMRLVSVSAERPAYENSDEVAD